MMLIPELNLSHEHVMSLRRHLRVPPGHVLLDGSNEPSSSPVSIIEPYEHTHRFRPKHSEIGRSVSDVFFHRFPFRSEIEWVEKQLRGEIGVNDTIASIEYKIGSNDILFHRNIGVLEPSVPDDIRIFSKNDHFIWLDKPAPIPMHSGGRYHRNTVVSLLERVHDGPVFIVHRLDAVTSGLILLARSESAAAFATQLIAGQQVQKNYEAIVLGNPPENLTEIAVGIKRDRGFLFKCSTDSDAKEATTRFEVLRHGDGWAHVKCIPLTGRTHQIRLHLAHWGYPIWDDIMYNGSSSVKNKSLLKQDRAISLVSLGINVTV